MNWYLKVVKTYVWFSGWARRKEYWMFVLVNTLISILLGILTVMISEKLQILQNLYGLFIFLPGIAALFRRLHDTDRSGWNIL